MNSSKKISLALICQKTWPLYWKFEEWSREYILIPDFHLYNDSTLQPHRARIYYALGQVRTVLSGCSQNLRSGHGKSNSPPFCLQFPVCHTSVLQPHKAKQRWTRMASDPNLQSIFSNNHTVANQGISSHPPLQVDPSTLLRRDDVSLSPVVLNSHCKTEQISIQTQSIHVIKLKFIRFCHISTAFWTNWKSNELCLGG